MLEVLIMEMEPKEAEGNTLAQRKRSACEAVVMGDVFVNKEASRGGS